MNVAWPEEAYRRTGSQRTASASQQRIRPILNTSRSGHSESSARRGTPSAPPAPVSARGVGAPPGRQNRVATAETPPRPTLKEAACGVGGKPQGSVARTSSRSAAVPPRVAAAVAPPFLGPLPVRGEPSPRRRGQGEGSPLPYGEVPPNSATPSSSSSDAGQGFSNSSPDEDPGTADLDAPQGVPVFCLTPSADRALDRLAAEAPVPSAQQRLDFGEMPWAEAAPTSAEEAVVAVPTTPVGAASHFYPRPRSCSASRRGATPREYVVEVISAERARELGQAVDALPDPEVGSTTARPPRSPAYLLCPGEQEEEEDEALSAEEGVMQGCWLGGAAPTGGGPAALDVGGGVEPGRRRSDGNGGSVSESSDEDDIRDHLIRDRGLKQSLQPCVAGAEVEAVPMTARGCRPVATAPERPQRAEQAERARVGRTRSPVGAAQPPPRWRSQQLGRRGASASPPAPRSRARQQGGASGRSPSGSSRVGSSTGIGTAAVAPPPRMGSGSRGVAPPAPALVMCGGSSPTPAARQYAPVLSRRSLDRRDWFAQRR